MNSIFLRIYGGMCAALILVAVLGVLALHMLNQVRSAPPISVEPVPSIESGTL